MGFALLNSCANKKSNLTVGSLKDSITKQYVTTFDSIKYFDTSNFSHKILKAFYLNDTNSLKEFLVGINRTKAQELEYKIRDTCKLLSEIESMNFDEAYRFIYSSAFCPEMTIITINQTNNKTNFHYSLYGNAAEVTMNSQCPTIIEEYDKILSQENWNKFKDTLNYYDFWGLQESNGIIDSHHDNLTIIGYTRGDEKYHEPKVLKMIWRSRPKEKAIFKAFDILLKMKNHDNHKGCL